MRIDETKGGEVHAAAALDITACRPLLRGRSHHALSMA